MAHKQYLRTSVLVVILNVDRGTEQLDFKSAAFHMNVEKNLYLLHVDYVSWRFLPTPDTNEVASRQRKFQEKLMTYH